MRPLEEADASVSRKRRNDPEIWKYTGSSPDRVITEEIEREWAKRVISDPTRINHATCPENGKYNTLGIRRILFNALTMYGKFVCAVICGIFTSRWLLKMFGESDYGLFVVIGSLTVMVSFLNTVLTSSTRRYISYSVGRSETADRETYIEDCRKWFGTSCLLHSGLAVVVMTIGIPLGCTAIREWLCIPQNRIGDCQVFFCVACVQLFLWMVSTPFQSMFYAKQRIAELSAYSVVSTILTLGGVWFMVSHSGDWFVWYGVLVNGLSVVFCVVVGIRAFMIFPECRASLSMMWSRERTGAVCRAAFWQNFAAMANMVRTHGVNILINKMFGPAYNASFSVANTVLTHTSSVSEALWCAFSPAMTNLEGAGRRDEMTQKMFVFCKISSLAYALFVVPLIIELPYVLKLWLVNPPEFASPVCRWLLIMYFFDCLTAGFGSAVTAINKLGKFYGFMGSASIVMLALMYVAVRFFGADFVSMFAFMAAVRIVASFVSVKLADDAVGFGWRAWCKSLLLPFAGTVAVLGAIGWSVRMFMTEGFVRLCATTGASVAVFSLCAWVMILSEDEKQMIRKYMASVSGKR